MRRTLSITRVVVGKLISLVLFLVLIGIFNFILDYASNDFFNAIVFFLNNNIGLILLIWVLFFIADLFYLLFFPFDLPAPIFYAIGSFFLIGFIFNIFMFIEDYFSLNSGIPFDLISLGVSIVIAILVLVVSYFKIFDRIGRRRYRRVRRIRRIRRDVGVDRRREISRRRFKQNNSMNEIKDAVEGREKEYY